MAYKPIITEHAEELIDQLVSHLLHQFQNEQAAIHLLDELDRLYDRLEENPFQFPYSPDTYLSARGYREEIITRMNYLLIYAVQNECVYILGVFHQLENYSKKLH